MVGVASRLGGLYIRQQEPAGAVHTREISEIVRSEDLPVLSVSFGVVGCQIWVVIHMGLFGHQSPQVRWCFSDYAVSNGVLSPQIATINPPRF